MLNPVEQAMPSDKLVIAVLKSMPEYVAAFRRAFPKDKDPVNAADRMVFQVPPLRNIEKTAPYYHNGKVATLEEAVEEMADYQLGETLSRQETESIITFLQALTGEIPFDYIRPPELPKSTPRTFKPDLRD